MRILLCFCFILCICSCQTSKWAPSDTPHFSWDDFETKLLYSNLLQKTLPKHSESTVFNTLKTQSLDDENSIAYSLNDSIIFTTKSTSINQSICETFVNKYIVLSHHLSRGAATYSNMVRDKIFIISLSGKGSIYKVQLTTPVKLVFHKKMLAYHKGSQIFYAIDNITENTLVLLDTHLKYHLLDLIPIEGPLILDD